MSFIDTISPDSAGDAVAAMYQRQQSAWGHVPNYAKVFCHRPEVMARWAQLQAEIKRPMDKRRFELVTFVAAHELRSSPCSLAHGNVLREFFSITQICAIAEDRCEGILGPQEQAIVRFARLVARDAACVSRDQVNGLKALGLSDADVFDIAATAAGRAFFTKILDALGVQPDSTFRRLDESLRRHLTVGRPIDEEHCVTLPASAPAA